MNWDYYRALKREDNRKHHTVMCKLVADTLRADPDWWLHLHSHMTECMSIHEKGRSQVWPVAPDDDIPNAYDYWNAQLWHDTDMLEQLATVQWNFNQIADYAINQLLEENDDD